MRSCALVCFRCRVLARSSLSRQWPRAASVATQRLALTSTSTRRRRSGRLATRGLARRRRRSPADASPTTRRRSGRRPRSTLEGRAPRFARQRRAGETPLADCRFPPRRAAPSTPTAFLAAPPLARAPEAPPRLTSQRVLSLIRTLLRAPCRSSSSSSSQESAAPTMPSHPASSTSRMQAYESDPGCREILARLPSVRLAQATPSDGIVGSARLFEAGPERLESVAAEDPRLYSVLVGGFQCQGLAREPRPPQPRGPSVLPRLGHRSHDRSRARSPRQVPGAGPGRDRAPQVLDLLLNQAALRHRPQPVHRLEHHGLEMPHHWARVQRGRAVASLTSPPHATRPRSELDPLQQLAPR